MSHLFQLGETCVSPFSIPGSNTEKIDILWINVTSNDVCLFFIGADWRVPEEDGSERPTHFRFQLLCVLHGRHYSYSGIEGICTSGKNPYLYVEGICTLTTGKNPYLYVEVICTSGKNPYLYVEGICTSGKTFLYQD